MYVEMYSTVWNLVGIAYTFCQVSFHSFLVPSILHTYTTIHDEAIVLESVHVNHY